MASITALQRLLQSLKPKERKHLKFYIRVAYILSRLGNYSLTKVWVDDSNIGSIRCSGPDISTIICDCVRRTWSGRVDLVLEYSCTDTERKFYVTVELTDSSRDLDLAVMKVRSTVEGARMHIESICFALHVLVAWNKPSLRQYTYIDIDSVFRAVERDLRRYSLSLNDVLSAIQRLGRVSTVGAIIHGRSILRIGGAPVLFVCIPS